MSWLTETLNKIAKSYKGLNTSAMQGAGSMGLLNIERAAEKMNPEEAKEFKLKAKANLVTGTMLAPAVPFLVNGLVTAPVTTALELAGGTAAGIGATLATDKAIEAGSDGKYTGFTDYVTKKFPDSNPYIVEQFHPAGLIGGLLGGWGTRNAFIRTPRGRVELVNSELAKNISNTKLNNSEFDKAVLSGKVGWAPALEIHYRHGSYNPNLSKFEVHNTWDVTNRNASPFKWFGTEVSSPKNMMDDRPYQYIGLTEIKKPMTQLGEYNIKGKNDTRNYLVAESRQRGADAYYLQGIADNKAKDQNVLIKFLDHNGEPGGFGIKTSKLTEAERFGLSKHDRTNDKKYGNLVFIRNVGLHDKPGNLPYMTEDGKVLLTNSENAFVNLTTDIPFRTHGNYSHRPGGEFMIINPRAFRGKSFISLDPSDSFLLNDNLQINPKHITVITGNKQILKSLAEKGFNVRTSPKLQLEYKRSITPHSNKKGIRLEKDGLEVTPKYTRVVDDYIDKYIGRPSIEDYIKLNQITNVDPHVSLLTNQITQLLTLENLKKLPLSESKNYIDKVLFEYPDKTKLYLGDILYEGPYTTTLRTPYKNVFFNPTSTIEFDFTKSLNLGLHPKNISQELINVILNYIQQHNITPLKKQGGPIHIKEKNKGKFTESAKRAGKSVQEHARDTVNNPKATKLQKKRALFALNSKKFKHD